MPTGDWTRDLSLAGRVLWPLSYRHLCTICAILSIYYWITDIHVWDVMHLVMTEQPHYRSYISSHFDLSSLISMARMQSAQRKKVKVWCPDRGLNPGPSTCRAEALPLSYRNLCTFRAVLSMCYWITDIHVWDVMHLVMTEQPHYWSMVIYYLLKFLLP